MPRHTPHRAKRLGRRSLAPPECLEHRNAPGALLLLPPLAQAFANDTPESTPATIQQEKAIRRGKLEKAACAPAVLEGDLLRIANQLAEDRLSSQSKSTSEAAVEVGRSSSFDLGAAELVSAILAPVKSTVAAKLPTLNTSSPSVQETKSNKLPNPQVTPVANSAAAFGATGGGANVNSGGGASNSGSSGGSADSSVPNLPPAVAPVTPVPSVTASQAVPAPAQLPSPAPSTPAAQLVTIVPTATAASTPTAPVVATPVVVISPPAAPTSTPQAQSTAISAAMSGPVIETTEVEKLLDRASAATPRNDAIIAVVDRNGRILGVRVEDGVNLDSNTLVFAIDGAVAKARTAAFFANGGAPITSRTVRFISQSTVTQREVESNPNITNTSSPERGPGFVAPIGIGGHFPPGVMLTPHVDLFAIEHTNRDGIIHPGEDLIRGTNDDVNLMTRFGADFASGVDIEAPESYGKVSGLLPNAQSRGIATLPGGIPLFKFGSVVGGIGVFFPGPDGYATFEQNFLPGVSQNPQDRLNAPLVLEAEYTAFAAAGGVGTIAGIPALADYVIPRGRIDLAGITLEIYGPHPMGERGLVAFGQKLGTGTVNGTNQIVNTNGDKLLEGEYVPEGWLVEPRASMVDNLTEADVRKIIEDGVDAANRVRAAIRSIGSRTRMVLSVTDTTGEILGLYRMPDATVFSIDVAVAKARNVAYYADADDLQQVDQVDENFDGNPDVAAGVAFTNRTFRYLASPFFPTGVDTAGSGPFSILNNSTLIDPKTGENIGAPMAPDAYKGVLAYDAFNPGSNFHEMDDADAVIGNQNGVVFFPGSTPLYKNGVLVGGLGVSGDGVDQDDVVTFFAGGDFIPGRDSSIVRSDQTFVRDIRLPYQKFGRNLLA